ncbi:MAG: hypothetical protein H0V97_07405 [Actinobacteria bacterium]|nr:hypothetical protein [Actinomycetota bacterium]
MSEVTRFSMTRTQRLRKALERAAQLPQDEDPYDFPMETTEGWFKSPGNPEVVVDATEVLRVKPGFRLVAYQYRAGGNGNAVVWALPIDAPFPEVDQCERLEGRDFDGIAEDLACEARIIKTLEIEIRELDGRAAGLLGRLQRFEVSHGRPPLGAWSPSQASCIRLALDLFR